MTIVSLTNTSFSSPPQAVLFDIDNTLYAYEPAHKKASIAVNLKASKLLGVTVEKFNEAVIESRKQVKLKLSTTASSHSRLLYFQRAIEILGLRTKVLEALDLEQTYWRTFLSSSELFEGVIDFIESLQSLGVKTAIITDLTAQIQFRKLIYFGLDKYFDYIVTSEEAGADKPDTAPFEIALDKLSVGPNQCWMIGDNAESDIGGAKKHGIFTFQKKHSGVVIEKSGHNSPDFIFYEFADLIEFLHKHNWINKSFKSEDF